MTDASFHAYRFTLEAQAPLVIASGDGDAVLDMLLARDANGLPMIPASSLAGALRAALSRAAPEDARRIFGFIHGSGGQRSKLTLTDGLAHWSDDRPRDGWHRLNREDQLVRHLSEPSPVTRQHVRIGEAGVVDDTGKFERSAAPTGTRFTFEISCWGEADGLDKVAQILRQGLFLGGATRSGYGRVICIREGRKSFDLETPEGGKAFRDFAAQDLGCLDGFEMSAALPQNTAHLGWNFVGTFEGPLLIGAPRPDGKGGRVPYEEIVVKWHDNRAAIGTRKVLTGSSIKGPLRHRTLFHLRKKDPENAEERINDLFGSALEVGNGQAGKLRFHDGEISGEKTIDVAHVSLDRFTGGARDKSGVLFTDSMIWQPTLCFDVDQLVAIDDNDQTAFEEALKDLCTGLLGLGAEWGEGAGVFAEGAVWKKEGAPE